MSMDGIQSYRGTTPAPPSVGSRHSAPLPAAVLNSEAAKTSADYVRALRRRFWMVLAVAVPLAVTSSILVLRLPPVYQAKAEIEINPPDINPVLSALVSHEIGRNDTSNAQFVPNRAARLQTRALAELVVGDAAIAPEVSQYTDAAFELFRTLSVIQVKKTNAFIVTLEGNDPGRTTRLLNKLLTEFSTQTKLESNLKLDDVAKYAEQNLSSLQKSLKDLDLLIEKTLKQTRTVGPGGRSILEEQYVNLGNVISQKMIKMADLQQQRMLGEFFPKFHLDGASADRAAQLAHLQEQAQYYTLGLEQMKRTIRHFDTDRAALHWSGRLQLILDRIDELRSLRTETTLGSTEMIMAEYQQDIENNQAQHQKLLEEMRKTIPEHQRVLGLLKDREEKAKQLAEMEARLSQFSILKSAVVNDECVRIPPSGVVEPTVPIKPNRPILIILGLVASLAAGIGTVCLCEYIDHSVKVPEHVTHGLALPLLGVVPRIRRTPLTHRGGHLWTPGAPDAVEADAYRNIRASLLGVTDKRGPIVTLLVTSAKAGEGKSTTAINLAATCAKAGERTLLLDIDLRRPSLAEAFIEAEPDEEIHGLVDVLRGELPWQRVLRHTELVNLDFVPSGDPRGIPIEILGTRELRQLLIALSHHYDRVILDGPAVLGLADCRVLGRVVDASLLVVRSAAHQLVTLHRAKAMLEQSHVAIAGVVFNGLSDDINSWSSYGYDPVPLAGRMGAAHERSSQPLGALGAGPLTEDTPAWSGTGST
jgi:capsular exopolysaccharide synthesis family protein